MTLRAFWGMHRMTRSNKTARESVTFPTDPSALFTVEQACAFLACSRGTIYNLKKKQLLLAIKIMGTTRFRRSDLEAVVLRAAREAS